jgi:hypothetical protein
MGGFSMVFWSFRGSMDETARETFNKLAEVAGDMALQLD